MDRVFAYTINSRVVWLSEKIFQIPVLDDMCRIHLVENCQKIEQASCIDYNVRYFNKFVQDDLVFTPLTEDLRTSVQINYEKTKCYVRLSEFIQCSYLSSLPIVFKDECDKIEILAHSILDCTDMTPEDMAKHQGFVADLILEKKTELKKRYLATILDLKNAKTLQAVKEVEYTLIYEGIQIT